MEICRKFCGDWWRGTVFGGKERTWPSIGEGGNLPVAPDDGKGQKLMESTHVEQNYLKKTEKNKVLWRIAIVPIINEIIFWKLNWEKRKDCLTRQCELFVGRPSLKFSDGNEIRSISNQREECAVQRQYYILLILVTFLLAISSTNYSFAILFYFSSNYESYSHHCCCFSHSQFRSLEFSKLG